MNRCAFFLMLCVPALAGTHDLRYSGIPLMFEPEGGSTGVYRVRSGALTVRTLPGAVEFVSGGTRLRMTFPGARRVPPEPVEKLPGYSNYLLGPDPSRWRTNVAQFRSIRYSGIYPGIDLLLYVRGQQIEYDWKVSAGADPRRIRMRFDPAASLTIDETGSLTTAVGSLQITHHRPAAYQETGGSRSGVTVDYANDASRHSARLQVGRYDRRRELIIDPTLNYSQAISGSGCNDSTGGYADTGAAIAGDAQGNAYIVGGTCSSDFPVTPNAIDPTPKPGINVSNGESFLLKLDPTGSKLLYATYFDAGLAAVSIDSAGNIWVAGTGNPNSPLVNPIQSAYTPCTLSYCWYGYIAELNPQGSKLLLATRVGGPSDSIGQMAFGPGGSIVFAGGTTVADVPVTANAFQKQVSTSKCPGCSILFIGALTPGATGLAFLTYLGGSGQDNLNGLAVDSTGAVYVAGNTTSPDFPTTAGSFQPKLAVAPGKGESGFITKLNSTGSQLVYSTYLGGTDGADLYGLAVEGQNAYVTGTTRSADFPVTPGAFQTSHEPVTSGVVTKLSADGASLAYSTYLADTLPSAIGVRSGVAYVTGSTFFSPSLPIVNPVQGGTLERMCIFPGKLGRPGPAADCPDIFVSALNPAGTGLTFSTFLAGYDSGSQATAMALDPSGSIYLIGVPKGFAGGGAGPDFPTIPAPGLGGGSILIAKISPQGETPYFSAASTTNALTYLPAKISPGELITIFGANFSEPGIYTAAGSSPPTELNGVSVTVLNTPAPILAVANVNGQEQINLQVPYNFLQTPRGENADCIAVAITISTALHGASVPTYVWCSAVADIPTGADPGIATTDGTRGAIQHGGDYSLVTSANPGKPGEVLVLYAIGLGAVTPPVASGVPAPSSPLSQTVNAPAVTVGGVPATVLFSGLAPGYVGLYQINFRLAPNTPAGDDDLIVGFGAFVKSKTVKLAVGN